MRANIQNMVTGVTQGFSKVLEIVGTGYAPDGRPEARAAARVFAPGAFAASRRRPHHDQAREPDAHRHQRRGKAQVGQVAADIRSVPSHRALQGKGIKYEGEYIRRKAGKAAGLRKMSESAQQVRRPAHPPLPIAAG